jgi:hypothetical protein
LVAAVAAVAVVELDLAGRSSLFFVAAVATVAEAPAEVN